MGAGIRHRRGAAPRATALVTLALAASASPAVAAPFTRSELPLPPRVYDLGVAYVDGDSDPDLFTTAHNNRQVVLIGNGNGGWDNQISALNLDHTPAFPGLEAINNAPTLDAPGLYAFFRPTGLRLVAHEVSARGALRSRAFRQATARDGAEANLRVLPGGGGDLAKSRIRYSIPPGGQLDAKMVPLALPVRFRPGGEAEVFVGSQAVRAQSDSFTVELRDRHGMGWADAEGDGDTDVFITRGGLAGRIKGHRNLVQDELMLQGGGTFADSTDEAGLRKGRCRARQAQPVDADGDGRTDLASSCKEGVTRLFLRRGGEYVNASGHLKRAGARGGDVEWVDVRGDLVPELATFEGGGVRLFQRTPDGSWVVAQRLRGLPGGGTHSIASADYDNDGDADVLVSKADGLALLQNREGRLAQRRPASVGLPERASGPVAWIDHQNDGLLDLYAPPGGIYEQQPGGGFQPSGHLASAELTRARAVWMDFDGDGDRDGAVTGREGGERVSSLYENHLILDHWLEVEVEGREGRREAPGARVRVAAGGVVQTAWIGQADSSRFSAGDWRAYFGLGGATSADRVTVRWTDGVTTTLTDVPDNQLLRVQRP
jgi:hypothetical protein